MQVNHALEKCMYLFTITMSYQEPQTLPARQPVPPNIPCTHWSHTATCVPSWSFLWTLRRARALETCHAQCRVLKTNLTPALGPLLICLLIILVAACLFNDNGKSRQFYFFIILIAFFPSLPSSLLLSLCFSLSFCLSSSLPPPPLSVSLYLSFSLSLSFFLPDCSR